MSLANFGLNILSVTASTGQLEVWNGVETFQDFINYDYTDYIPNATTPAEWLTNVPQNYKIGTQSQMKLLLTRIGFNSKFFISGDLEQFDRHKDKTQTGLWDALKKFQNMEDIGVFEFKSTDIVRNPLISKILEKYEE